MGVPGARWWDKVRFRGDEVLGEWCSSWGSEIGSVTWISKDEPCGEFVRLIWLSLRLRFFLSVLSRTCRTTGGSLVARRSLLTLPRAIALESALFRTST